MKVLITHTWNDELYMAGWLRHHVPMFDHGVIIYYPCPDGTLSIIKRLAPKWEVVSPYTEKLTSGPLEEQLEAIEKGHPGSWKIVLTVTEYLISKDLDAALAAAPTDAFFISGVGLVDSPEEAAKPYDREVPVVAQRSHGFDMLKDEVQSKDFKPRNFGRRLFHRRDSGNYYWGRHETRHRGVVDYGGIRLARAFYSPYNEEGIQRKMRMGQNIQRRSVHDCVQHFWTREQIQQDYEALLKGCHPLDPEQLGG